MDKIDAQLVALLREDARRPVTVLADVLGVSRATVQARLARLLRDGAILGFTVRLPEASTGVRAVAMLSVAGERVEFVARTLKRMPEVQAVWSTNGRWDLVAEIACGGLPAFDLVLGQMRRIEGVSATETSLLLAPAG